MTAQEQKEIRKLARSSMLAMKQQNEMIKLLTENKKSSRCKFKYHLTSEYVDKEYYNLLELEDDLSVGINVIIRYLKYPDKRQKSLITKLGFTLEKEML